jgi:hypothetical protein
MFLEGLIAQVRAAVAVGRHTLDTPHWRPYLPSLLDVFQEHADLRDRLVAERPLPRRHAAFGTASLHSRQQHVAPIVAITQLQSAQVSWPFALDGIGAVAVRAILVG